jgi:hypothetical protein
MTGEFLVSDLTQYGRHHDLHQNAGIPSVMLGFAVLGRAVPHGRTLGGLIFVLAFALFLSAVVARRGVAALWTKKSIG